LPFVRPVTTIGVTIPVFERLPDIPPFDDVHVAL
jgi:hypothetical protein